MPSTISPNMNLIVPTTGQEPGPTYADDVNASLTLVDQHDHTAGKGVQITPAGININSSLPFNNNSASGLSAATFISQSSASSTLQSVSVAPGSESPSPIQDLWYTDSNGTKIQITQNGQLAAVATTVSGISYSGGTFVFTQTQSGFPTTPANLDGGSVTIRPNTAGTIKGVSLIPSSSIPSTTYSLTLPLVPVSSQFLTIDNTGVIAGNVALSGGITTSMIASGTILASNVQNNQLAVPYVAQTSNYNVQPADGYIEVNSTGGPFTLNLYQVTGFPTRTGLTIRIKKTSSDSNAVTINASGPDQIDGAGSTSVNTQQEAIVLLNNGNNWVIESRTYPQVWTAATFTLPTTGGHANNGIVSYTSQSSFVRRVGDSLECKVYLQGIGVSANNQSYLGLPTSGAFSGLAVDTTKTSQGGVLGTMFVNAFNNPFPFFHTVFGNQQVYSQTVFNNGSDSAVVSFAGLGAFNAPNSFQTAVWNTDFASGTSASISATFTVPIQGWN